MARRRIGVSAPVVYQQIAKLKVKTELTRFRNAVATRPLGPENPANLAESRDDATPASTTSTAKPVS